MFRHFKGETKETRHKRVSRGRERNCLEIFSREYFRAIEIQRRIQSSKATFTSVTMARSNSRFYVLRSTGVIVHSRSSIFVRARPSVRSTFALSFSLPKERKKNWSCLRVTTRKRTSKTSRSRYGVLNVSHTSVPTSLLSHADFAFDTSRGSRGYTDIREKPTVTKVRQHSRNGDENGDDARRHERHCR